MQVTFNCASPTLLSRMFAVRILRPPSGADLGAIVQAEPRWARFRKKLKSAVIARDAPGRHDGMFALRRHGPAPGVSGVRDTIRRHSSHREELRAISAVS